MKMIYKYAFWITLVFFVLTIVLLFTNGKPSFSFHKAAAKAGNLPDMNVPLIQIVLLLDTSSSMNGLIEQAKAHLWKMINKLSATRKNNKIPKLQVALYEYGKSSLSSISGHIHQITPFSRDMDLPDRMKDISKEEQKQYIDEMSEKRERIREKIQKLYKEREEYVAEKKRSGTHTNTLEYVMMKTITEQAKTNGFEITE